MNSGRGAKGSINDRLISMMYRNRYKLAEQRKKGYTKETKQKQKEYLRSIQDFDLEKDAPNLEEEDKKVIEKVFNDPAPAVLASPKEDVVPLTPTFQEKVDTIKQGAEIVESGPKTTDSEISEPSIETLHDLSDKMMDVDLTTENFDFEHYDYYEVLSKYTGIADFKEEEIIEPDVEIAKVDDEEVILSELSDFIEDSKELIVEIKEELKAIEEEVPLQKTEQDLEQLEERYIKLREKISLLKAQYDTIKEKYDFADFEILSSIEMMEAIDDYRDKASLEEMETLVDVCKKEIDQIDGVVIEEKRSVAVAENMETQEKEIIKRDQAFKKNKEGVIYLDNLEKKIAEEAREEAKIIAELEKKLGNFTTEVETVTRTVYHTERLFGSFLRIATGILTVPFSGRQIFGTMLGTHLINRGLHQLRDSLNPEFVQTREVRHRYQSIEREILNSKDYVKMTSVLIDDSLDQLDKFDEEFKEVEKQIESLKVRLAKKKDEVKIMEKDLARQYEENKIKVKKAS